MTPISLLFVPASQPVRFAKASCSSASAYIIDLEDTLDDEQKDEGRLAILAYDKTAPKPFWVRINGATSKHFLADLACVQACQHLAGVVLAKAQSKDEIDNANFGKPIIAVIETPLGLANLASLATAKGLFALGFGALDLAQKLGVVQDSDGARAVFDQIRYQLVLHSAINGLQPPIETVFANFKDLESLSKTACHAYEMGFGGQFAIHPAQLETIHNAYALHPAHRTFATKVIQHHQRTGQMVFEIDGQMVDLPIITWAKKALAMI